MRQILQHIESHGTVYQAFNKCRHPTKLGISAVQTIDDMMQKDDETTAKELVVTLRVNGISLSTTTAQKGQHLLGWTRHYSKYVHQIVPEDCNGLVNTLGNPTYVIWTNETKRHHHFLCYKRRSKPRYKPRPRHPVKVHV